MHRESKISVGSIVFWFEFQWRHVKTNNTQDSFTLPSTTSRNLWVIDYPVLQRPSPPSSSTLSDWMSNLRLPSPSQEDVIQERVAQDLISSIEKQHHLSFVDSKFPLFGFMREVATNEKKHPKLYLWQGEADAIAVSIILMKYVIVEFKVVDNLLDYWKKNRFMREAFASVLGLREAFAAAHEASLLAFQPHSSHP